MILTNERRKLIVLKESVGEGSLTPIKILSRLLVKNDYDETIIPLVFKRIDSEDISSTQVF